MPASSPPPRAYSILFACPTGLSRSQVFVDFSASYDRMPHPDPRLEESISQIWDQRLHENPSLYNGLKFRFGGYLVHTTDEDLGNDSNVCIHLGLTDYRTFVGTNLSPLWEKFLISDENDSICGQHTASPLGNGAVVESADGKILVLQRSYNVGEFPGHYVFPGGHSEPQEIGISCHIRDEDTRNSSCLNDKVSEEMFDGITREVVEEIGVPAGSLTYPTFIGISRRLLNVRPTAFFHVKCHMESEDIRRFYSNAQDGYESTQLFAFSQDELRNVASKMPGCHQGGHALYELMVKEQKIL
ncbi:hypothetical protein AMTRI_Chr08g163980 [Amborella trichopoda]|uniref:nudix hydrolase 9 n=1 Tax=Amborella trichopoda TaxID=13333 RepID=UPI0005D43926|nr:nudix hydrolase 9 [Amborella trichopoda]|eukprot:XP_011625644.1 nudix hydrolase 9 [Amborella trichopoda]